MTEVLVVSDPSQGRYAQRIESGAHELVADEPEPRGDDLGPDPYALLLASLGACTAMTLQMYAAQKEWALEGVTVRLRYERVHVEDWEDGETVKRRIHRIERELALEGELSAEQRDRLIEIAERCPIHRTLTEEKDLVTKLAGG